MTNWKYVLDIKSIFQDEEISVEDKGKAVGAMIRITFPKTWFDWNSNDYDEDLDNIVSAFENITGYDNVSPVEEFDGWLSALYDFGDTEVAPFGQWPANKMAWIATSF